MIRLIKHRFGYLEASEIRLTFGLFFFLAHGGPDIGGDQVGVFDRCLRVMQQCYLVTSGRHDVGAWLVAFRAAYAQMKTELTGRIDPGVAHVIAITNPYCRASLYTAAQLGPGHYVG